MSWDVVRWREDSEESRTDVVPSVWANSDKSSYKFPFGPMMTDQKKNELINSCKDLTEGEFNWHPAICKYSSSSLTGAKQRAKTIANSRMSPLFIFTSESEDSGDKGRLANSQLGHDAKQQCLGNDGNYDSARPIINNLGDIASTSKTSGSSPLPDLNSSKKNYTSDDIYRLIEKMDKKLDTILIQSNYRPISQQAKEKVLDFIPIGTKVKFSQFNRMIENPEYKDAYVNILCNTEGSNPKKNISLQMKKTIVSKVFISYSSLGKKGTLDFCRTNVYRAISEATRKKFPAVTDEEIFKHVSQCLATSAKESERAKRIK